jgi:hypothetical protein
LLCGGVGVAARAYHNSSLPLKPELRHSMSL